MGMLEFTNKIEKEYLLYHDEAVALMIECELHPVFIDFFKTQKMYRWVPQELINLINSRYPITHQVKEIPDFLLKKS